MVLLRLISNMGFSLWCKAKKITREDRPIIMTASLYWALDQKKKKKINQSINKNKGLTVNFPTLAKYDPHSVGKALHPLSSSEGWTDYNPSCPPLSESYSSASLWDSSNKPIPPSMGTRGTPTLLYYKACLLQPLLTHSAPQCNLHVACPLALSAFFPNCKYICLITAANLIQPVLGIVCLAISHYLGWGVSIFHCRSWSEQSC